MKLVIIQVEKQEHKDKYKQVHMEQTTQFDPLMHGRFLYPYFKGPPHASKI